MMGEIEKITITYDKNRNEWVAKEDWTEGSTFYGRGITPHEALKDIKTAHDELEKAMSEI